MYSLYRAWLMRDAVAAASLASPPDVVVTVGNTEAEHRGDGPCYGYRFVAHKHLLSLHSGYLKSLIQSEGGDGAPLSDSVATVSLPSISPEAFAPLLSFMYTGFLDLTDDNIYSVLLATHLLHMPRALDLCRAYLVRNRPDSDSGSRDPFRRFRPDNPGIVKPIPSRKVHSAFLRHPFWVPPPVNVSPIFLRSGPDGPFRTVSPLAENREPTTPTAAEVLRRAASPPAIPSTSKSEGGARSPTPSSSAPSPCPTGVSYASDEAAARIVESPRRKQLHGKKEPRGTAVSCVSAKKTVNNENLKVVLDVACCDGPVRFHRVLNECYGMSLEEIADVPTDGDRSVDDGTTLGKASTAADRRYLDGYPSAPFLGLESDLKFSNFMHRQMLDSDLLKKSKSSRGVIQLRKVVQKETDAEGARSRDENETETETEDDRPGRIYTCVYCKHTFKSRYCYRKHAKRHINPVEDEPTGTASVSSAPAHVGGPSKNFVIARKVLSTTRVEGKDGECGGGGGGGGSGTTARREVRLLDMNVQYYPCKTCGSKFPSYYFVHKHRKMCHSGEETVDDSSSSNHQGDDCNVSSFAD